MWTDCGYKVVLVVDDPPLGEHAKLALDEAKKLGATVLVVDNKHQGMGLWAAGIRIAMPLWDGFKPTDYVVLGDLDQVPLNCPYLYVHDFTKFPFLVEDYAYYIDQGR